MELTKFSLFAYLYPTKTVYYATNHDRNRKNSTLLRTTEKYIYVYKIDSTAEVAVSQIKTKGYVTAFLAQSVKTVYIIGVNFVTAEKKINEIVVGKWQDDDFVQVVGDFVPKQ